MKFPYRVVCMTDKGKMFEYSRHSSYEAAVTRAARILRDQQEAGPQQWIYRADVVEKDCH